MISFYIRRDEVAQMLIRDVDPAVVEKLKDRARLSHRSLESELRLIIETAADQRTVDIATEVDRIRALFSGRSFGDSTTLAREDRNR
jgi:hypothetical protein